MAKRRQIHPETWTDTKFVGLSPLARLLFIGMWNFACDNGHLDDDALQLKMRVLPADNCDVAELLEEIVASGMVTRQGGFLKVINLPTKQALDMRYLVFCDHCDEDSERHYTHEDKPGKQRANKGRTQGTRRAHDERSTGAPRSGDGDGDGDGDGGKVTRRKAATPLPDDWQPTDKHREYAAAHRLDVNREAFKFRNHATGSDRRQANWNAAFNTWLAKAEEYAAPKRGDERPSMWETATRIGDWT